MVFSHWPLFIIIALIGLWVFDKKFIFQLVLLSVFSIIVNKILKGLFKFPLSPTLHKEGYAFPSGHMQLATVFYGYFHYYSSKKIRYAIVLLLTGIGFGLIYYQYHTLADVLGGVVTGGLILVTVIGCGRIAGYRHS